MMNGPASAITRQQALIQCLPTYNTGKPCKVGHISDRKTKTGLCIECLRSKRATAYARNKVRVLALQKAYRDKNRLEILARDKDRYARNRLAKIKYQTAYYQRNKVAISERVKSRLTATAEKASIRAKRYYSEHKREIVIRTTEYKRNNRDKYNMWGAKRRGASIRATPEWLSKTQLSEMVIMYASAKNSGSHVDHIIPLLNKSVCGLHVPWNLQLLTPKENMSKGNRVYQILAIAFPNGGEI